MCQIDVSSLTLSTLCLLLCSCCDDLAEFNLRNNATLHFYFAHYEKDKSISDAFRALDTSMTDYDVIVANNGNPPIMTPESTLKAAEAAQAADIPFYWLSTYDGFGEVWHWTRANRQRLFDLPNARHIAVRDMVRSVMGFTKGKAEGGNDAHFCLPGPPVGIASLLLQMIWALQSGTEDVG